MNQESPGKLFAYVALCVKCSWYKYTFHYLDESVNGMGRSAIKSVIVYMPLSRRSARLCTVDVLGSAALAQSRRSYLPTQ